MNSFLDLQLQGHIEGSNAFHGGGLVHPEIHSSFSPYECQPAAGGRFIGRVG